MTNEFRRDYHVEVLTDHSLMISQLDRNLFLQSNEERLGMKDVAGIFTIIITNQDFSSSNNPKIEEPDLVNIYELRNVKHNNRHFGDNKPVSRIITLALANLKKKEAKELRTSIEKWAYVIQDLKMSIENIEDLRLLKTLQDKE